MPHGASGIALIIIENSSLPFKHFNSFCLCNGALLVVHERDTLNKNFIMRATLPFLWISYSLWIRLYHFNGKLESRRQCFVLRVLGGIRSSLLFITRLAMLASMA